MHVRDRERETRGRFFRTAQSLPRMDARVLNLLRTFQTPYNHSLSLSIRAWRDRSASLG